MSSIGMNIINEMSKEDLINEILDWQRQELETFTDLAALKMHVVNFRLEATKRRLMKEAGIEQTGLFGSIIKDMEDDG